MSKYVFVVTIQCTTDLVTMSGLNACERFEKFEKEHGAENIANNDDYFISVMKLDEPSVTEKHFESSADLFEYINKNSIGI